MSVGDFFADHRKAIDARKAHLTRVGVTAPDVAPLRDTMPSQADVLTMPVTHDAPLIEATHEPLAPAKPKADYEQPKLTFSEE